LTWCLLTLRSPYGTTACKWDTVIPFELMWEELKRITKDNGAICLFGSEPFSSHLRLSNIKMFKYDWIWHKNFSGGFASAKYKPMQYHEIVSIFSIKKHNYYPIYEEYADSVKKRFKDGDAINNAKSKKNNINKINAMSNKIELKRGKYPSSVKYFKAPNRSNGQRYHPTQKPVALLEYLIKTYTLEGETVLDFTMGSGSTGVACKNLSRNFIGIEKEEKYFNIARERIYGLNGSKI